MSQIIGFSGGQKKMMGIGFLHPFVLFFYSDGL